MFNSTPLNGAQINGASEAESEVGGGVTSNDAIFNGFTFNGAQLNGSGQSAGSGDGALYVNVTLPALTGHAELWEFRVDGILPALTGSAIMRQSATTGQAIGLLPALTGEALFGARFNATLPKLTGDAQLTSTHFLRANGTLPALTGSAVLNKEIVLSASATLPKLQGAAYTGAVINANLPKLQGTSTLTVQQFINANGTLPALTGDAILTAQNTLRMNATLPALESFYFIANATLPALTGAALLSTDEARYLVAYAMNLSNGGMTRYDGYEFDYLVRFRGQALGLSLNGVYRLDADDDSGVPIDAYAEIPPSDFGTRIEKRAPYVYVGSENAEQVSVTATVDEGSQYSAVTRMAGRNKRAKLPRGPKGVYWGFRVTNISGGPLHIDGLDVLPDVVRRKV